MADINLISARAICATCGLSDELAQEIVRTRRLHGPFRCMGDLWRVEGMTTTAVEVLSSVFHINTDTSTRRFPTKNIYPRISGNGSPRSKDRHVHFMEKIDSDNDPRTIKKGSQKEERYGSRSTSRYGVKFVEPDNEKEMVSIAIKNVHGEDHNTLARTAHVQKSPSGNKLYIECEDIREYQITGVNPINGVSGTSPVARAGSNAHTEQGNNLGNSKFDPINFRRNHLRGEFSKTKCEFWNRIEKGWKGLELAIQNTPMTRKQFSSPERFDIGRSRGRKDGESKSRKRKRTPDAGVAGTREQQPSPKRRKTRPSREREKKSGKKDDKKKSRREARHSRDRKKKSDRKDRKKENKTETSDEVFFV